MKTNKRNKFYVAGDDRCSFLIQTRTFWWFNRIVAGNWMKRFSTSVDWMYSRVVFCLSHLKSVISFITINIRFIHGLRHYYSCCLKLVSAGCVMRNKTWLEWTTWQLKVLYENTVYIKWFTNPTLKTQKSNRQFFLCSGIYLFKFFHFPDIIKHAATEPRSIAVFWNPKILIIILSSQGSGLPYVTIAGITILKCFCLHPSLKLKTQYFIDS